MRWQTEPGERKLKCYLTERCGNRTRHRIPKAQTFKMDRLKSQVERDTGTDV